MVAQADKEECRQWVSWLIVVVAAGFVWRYRKYDSSNLSMACSSAVVDGNCTNKFDPNPDTATMPRTSKLATKIRKKLKKGKETSK